MQRKHENGNRVILLTIALLLFISSAGAIGDAVAQVLPTNVPLAQPGNTTNGSVIQVFQGDPDNPFVLYWNETADLTSVEGWDGMVQRVPGGDIVDVSGFTNHIFIDPKIFPLGTWFKYDSNGYDSHGNDVAFKIKEGIRPASVIIYANNSNVSFYGNNYTLNTQNLPLPLFHVADYVVAHGDPLNISFDGDAYIWVFQHKTDGGMDMILPRFGQKWLRYSVDDIQDLSPGDYDLVIQHFGNNTAPDVIYDNQSISRTLNGHEQVLYAPMDSTHNVTINGFQPWMVERALSDKLAAGRWIQRPDNTSVNIMDDTLEIRSLQVDGQTAEIKEVNELERGNQSQRISLIQVSGYTPLAAGNYLKVVLDWDKQNNLTIGDYTWTTTVLDSNPGDLRQFTTTVPLYYDQMAAGPHFFYILTPDGTKTNSVFNLNSANDSGLTEAPYHGKYIGGNLFVPTPTPEIVNHTVYVTQPPQAPIVQYVYVTITPSLSEGVVVSPIILVIPFVFLVIVGLWYAWKRKLIFK